MTTKEVNEYFKKYGRKAASTKIAPDVSALVSKDFTKVEWNNQEYFIPKSHTAYSERDIDIFNFLTTETK